MNASMTSNENIDMPKSLGSVSRCMLLQPDITENGFLIYGLRLLDGREYDFVTVKKNGAVFIIPRWGNKVLLCKIARFVGLDKSQRNDCVKLMKTFAEKWNKILGEDSFIRETRGSMDIRGIWFDANLVLVFLAVFNCSKLHELFISNVDEKRYTMVLQVPVEKFKLENPVDQKPESKQPVNIKNTCGRLPSEKSKEKQLRPKRENLISELWNGLLNLRVLFEQQKDNSK